MKKKMIMMMTETQDDLPKIQEDLERVGITGLRTLVIINWKGREYRFIPEVEITIDLDKGRKGAHMSRLIESITEFVEKEVAIKYNSIEELEKHILKSLKEKHPYKRGEISMKTQLIVEKRTPVTKKKTMETYDVLVKLCSKNGFMEKILRVDVIGSTVCPHAMRERRTHMQRALGILEIETNYDNKIELEEMIECVESSFSSEVYTLLKTKDEHHLVKKMFSQPKFVEDVTREILHKAKEKFKGCKIFAKVISYESIHKHNVLAEGSCRS
jgi:GTP cyclohydrolase-4